MWAVESDDRPSDPAARQIRVTLAQSGPRYVSPDEEFAVWSASLGEERDGERATLVGALGHVNPGEQLVCIGAFSEHVWQPLLAATKLPYRKPHAMRHSYATWFLEAGADIRWMQRQLGRVPIRPTPASGTASELATAEDH